MKIAEEFIKKNLHLIKQEQGEEEEPDSACITRKNTNLNLDNLNRLLKFLQNPEEQIPLDRQVKGKKRITEDI